MTQQPLPLDQFEQALDMVFGMIDYNAYKAIGEIREMLNFQRRSMGQTTRRAIERVGR